VSYFEIDNYFIEIKMERLFKFIYSIFKSKACILNIIRCNWKLIILRGICFL